MNRQEAIEVLNDKGEHKFLFGGVSPVYVVARAREDDLQALLHEHLAQKLVELGVFPDLEGVMGGYCKVLEDALRYWGESSYPIKAATAEQFNAAVDQRGIELI